MPVAVVAHPTVHSLSVFRVKSSVNFIWAITTEKQLSADRTGSWSSAGVVNKATNMFHAKSKRSLILNYGLCHSSIQFIRFHSLTPLWSFENSDASGFQTCVTTSLSSNILVTILTENKVQHTSQFRAQVKNASNVISVPPQTSMVWCIGTGAISSLILLY
jgi:hypothetical protein